MDLKLKTKEKVLTFLELLDIWSFYELIICRHKRTNNEVLNTMRYICCVLVKIVPKKSEIYHIIRIQIRKCP